MSAPAIQTFPREEFLTRRFRYRRGEHVTVVGPTGCGKTHLVYQLLERVARPSLPAIVLVKKPRDAVIVEWGKRLHYRRVPHWPPPVNWWNPWHKPPGYLVWPRTNFTVDIQTERARKAAIFRKALMDGYRRGNRILYVDDTYGISEILDLDDELIELWTELRSMDGSLWTSFQKPSHVPTWAYGQAEHLFLFHDPDKRSRERFAEIGGVDPDLVRDAVMALPRHAALYIRRDGPRMCVLAP